MTTLAEMVVRIGGDAAGLTRSVAVASRDVTAFAKRVDTVGASMQRMGRSSVKSGLLVGAGLAYAVHTGMQFDKTMSLVRASTGAQGKQFDQLRAAAIKYGMATQFSGQQVAQAMVEMGKAGFNTAQTLAAIPGVLSAAAASGEDMATVSNIMVNTLTGFGLAARDAGKVSDALAFSANATTASITDFGEALKYVAPVAHQAGMSFDEANGALIALAKVGIQGSMAGTNLRGVILSMEAPNKRVTASMAKLHLSFRDAKGQMLPFATQIDVLKKALAGLSQQKQDQFLARMFGRENISAAQQFLQIGGNGLRKFAAESNRSKGAAAAFAKVMRDNLSGDLENLKGSIETASIGLADDLTPSLRKVTIEVNNLVNAYGRLDPQTRVAVSHLIAATAVFLTMAGTIGIVGGTMIRGAALMSRVFIPVVWALRAVGAPVLLLVRSFGDLGAALRLMLTASPLARVFLGIASAASEVAGVLIAVGEAIASLVATIAAIVGAPVEVIVAAIVAIGAAAVLLVVKWRSVVAALRSVWTQVRGLFQQGWQALHQMTAERAGYLVAYVATRFALLPVTIARAMFNAAAAIASAAPGAISAAAKWGSGVVTGLVHALPGAAAAVYHWMVVAVSAVASFIGAAAKEAYAIGVAIVQGIAQGIKSAPGIVKDAAVGAVKGALKAARDAAGIKSPSRVAALEIGLPFAQGIAVGILSGGAGAAQAAVDVAQRVIDRTQAAFDKAQLRRDLSAAKKTKGGDDDRSALQAIRMAKLQAVADRAQRAVDALSASMGRFQTAEGLAASAYGLSVSLNGGVASIDQQRNRITELTSEYGNLAAFLQKNAKKLGADARSSILSELQGLSDEMNQIRESITQSAIDTMSSVNNLADANYTLSVALRGGSASLEQQSQHLADLQAQYAQLTSFMASNPLSADQTTGFLGQLAGIADAMTSTAASIREASRPTHDLADAYYNLSVALNGGTASLAMQADHLAALNKEYADLYNYLQTTQGLSVSETTSILNELAGLANDINQTKQESGLGTTGSTNTVDSSGASSTDGASSGARLTVNQNFIGPNVDHFTASRDALFAYQTAALAPSQ